MATPVEANNLVGGNFTQFLTDDEYLFIDGYGSWTPTGASLAVEKDFLFRKSFNTLKVTPLTAPTPPATSTTVELSHAARIVDNNYFYDKITLTVFVYPPSVCEAQITIVDNLSQSETSSVVKLPGQKWSLVRGPEVRVLPQTSTQTFTSTISLTTFGGTNPIYLAIPVLVNSLGFTDDDFVRECNLFLPPVLAEIDAEQINPSFPMARMMDVGLTYADNAFQQSLNFRYVDISDGYNENDNTTKSTLVDPDVAEPKYLPWLAQFVGVRFEKSAGGTTPWRNLPTDWDAILLDIDPTADVNYSISSISRDGSGAATATLATSPTGLSAGDTISITGTTNFDGQFLLTGVDTGTNIIDWDDEGAAASESTGTVTLVDEQWIEIEAYDTSDANFIPGRRDLIITARTGINAGTKNAIMHALHAILTGTQAVDYIVDIYDDPWLITIHTLTSETVGGVTGQQSDAIMRSIAKCRPMGFKIVHQCVDSI